MTANLALLALFTLAAILVLIGATALVIGGL